MRDIPETVFFHPEKGALLKEKLGYSGIQLSVYMPTFRGKTDAVEKDSYVALVKDYLRRMDQQLTDQQILLVKLHPLVQSQLDTDSYQHIRPFPTEYDTYEILNACDVLITDYSSVMYDFAVTGRRILLFAYDMEDYRGHRGMYEDISAYPFPILRTPEELTAELKKDSGHPDDDFLRKYATFEQANATRDICRHVLLGEKIRQEAAMPGTKKKKSSCMQEVFSLMGSQLLFTVWYVIWIPRNVTTIFRTVLFLSKRIRNGFRVSRRAIISTLWQQK